MKRLTLILLNYLVVFPTWGDSPPNLSTDIKWQDSGGEKQPHYNSVRDIEMAFNHARQEEIKQFGLSENAIKPLTMPSQAEWEAMNDDAKALFLLNNERISRDKMIAGIIGLPYAGIESSVDAIAQNYATLLHDSNAIGHYQPSGNPQIDNPSQRMDNDPIIGKQCREFLSRTENLAYFASYSTQSNAIPHVPLPLERSIYNWIYNDSDSNWGHREAILLQDKALGSNRGGYANNKGSLNHEGYLGFHVIGSEDYKPFTVPDGFNNYGVVVVMNIIDPVSDQATQSKGCQYQVTLGTDDASQTNLNPLPIPVIASPKTTDESSDGASQFPILLLIIFTLFVNLKQRLLVLKENKAYRLTNHSNTIQ